MLSKEDAVALFSRYEALLGKYMRAIRMGDRTSEMYSIFPYLYNALNCISANDEKNYSGVPFYSCEAEARKILGDSRDPLEIVQNFVGHYSQEEFSKQLLADVSTPQFLTNLNEFYAELSSFCTPKPTILYKGRFHNELSLKFPNVKSHDNFVSMMGADVGVTYSNNLVVLFIPGKVENGHLVATFPTSALREQAINLLGLTGQIITRQGENQLIINDTNILAAGQNIAITTPEHLYKEEQKQAYMNFQIIAKGLGSYAKCPHSFFHGFPAEINKKIASTFADVLGVEVELDTADRVASTYMGS